jgi:hypothetical protein
MIVLATTMVLSGMLSRSWLWPLIIQLWVALAVFLYLMM